VPRDRAGEFDPQVISKGQRRFGGFGQNIIAQGMTVREEDVVEWQNRPLESMYPVVFFDALRVRIREEGSVKNKAVYLAFGIQRDGTNDVLSTLDPTN
jgi:transposase-like protein